MKSKDIQELHKWLANLLKEKYINKADIKQILNDFDWDNSNQMGAMPKITELQKTKSELMKTAKELFDEFATKTGDLLVQYESNFIEAIAEHDKDIKDLIDEMIKRDTDDPRYKYEPATVFSNAPLALIQTAMESRVQILTELEERLK